MVPRTRPATRPQQVDREDDQHDPTKPNAAAEAGSERAVAVEASAARQQRDDQNNQEQVRQLTPKKNEKTALRLLTETQFPRIKEVSGN